MKKCVLIKIIYIFLIFKTFLKHLGQTQAFKETEPNLSIYKTQLN